MTEVKFLRHYVIVRSDLPTAQKMVQIGHAAGESAVLGVAPNNQTRFLALQGFIDEIQAIIPDLEKRGYRYVQVVEDEGPFAGEVCAIGIEPSVDNRLRKILYYFKQAE